MAPDPKPVKRPRKPIRHVEPKAVARAKLRWPDCAACGRRGADGHHLLPKGSPHFGDDVEANIVTLCGSGTMGCHGANHGSPYVVRITPNPKSMTQFEPFDERRDRAWVRGRIGRTLLIDRPDSIEYVIDKLGVVAGRDFLLRTFFIEV